MFTRMPRKYSISVQSAQIARSAVCHVWRWVSMNPGITTMPLASIRSASEASIEGATSAMRSPSTRTLPASSSPIESSIDSTYPFSISRRPPITCAAFQFRLRSSPAGLSRRRFDRGGAVHVALDASHASVANVEEDPDLGLDLDAAALATPVLPLQDHDAIAGVDEVLRLEPALIPRLQVLVVEVPVLIDPACDPAFLEPADRGVELDLRNDEVARPLPIASHEGFVELLDEFDVLARHVA